MGRLTTHVLDTSLGRPGQGIRIEVFRLDGEERVRIKEVITNDDGRCDGPILEGEAFSAGVFELVFHAGDYLRRHSGERVAAGASGNIVDGEDDAGDTGQDREPCFLDLIPLRFGVADASQHYHVPLLLSPYSYSTYRGS